MLYPACSRNEEKKNSQNFSCYAHLDALLLYVELDQAAVDKLVVTKGLQEPKRCQGW